MKKNLLLILIGLVGFQVASVKAMQKDFLNIVKYGSVRDLDKIDPNKVDVSLGDERGDTALHWAVYRAHPDLILKLRQFGAQLNAKNKHQLRPIDAAFDPEATPSYIIEELNTTNTPFAKKDEVIWALQVPVTRYIMPTYFP